MRSFRAFWAAAAAAIALLVVSARSQGAPDELPAILLSRQLMEAESLDVGDVVRLSAEASGANARSFRIAGAYEPMPDPARLTARRLEARLHLPDLLAVAPDSSNPDASESVTAVNIALTDPEDASDFSRALSAKIPGIVAQPTARGDERSTPFVVLERFHVAIAMVTVFGSAIFLLALMVIRADERRETFGTLRLIGVPTRRVLLEVLVEGLLIAFAGALFGVAFAWATEGLFNRFFQAWYDTSLVFLRVTPAVAGRSVVAAVPLGVLASLAASWTLIRRHPLVLVRR